MSTPAGLARLTRLPSGLPELAQSSVLAGAPGRVGGATTVRQVEVHAALTQPALAGTRRRPRTRLTGTPRPGQPTATRPTAGRRATRRSTGRPGTG